MENTKEREMGHLFGLMGGLFILSGGLFAIAFGVADLALGRIVAGASSLGAAIVLFMVGGLVVLFAHLAEHGWKDRGFTSGVMLVVLGLIGLAALGFGANVLALVGGIFALLAGVLYLIEPTQRAASALATAG